MGCSTPSIPVFHYLPKLLRFLSNESVMLSRHLILCHSVLFLPSIFPGIRVLSNESALHIRWPEYWSFSFSISPSKGYSGLVSFRIVQFDFLAVQGTVNSILQHSMKISILHNSALFMVQLSHPCMTIGKTIVLTMPTFVAKVMSLFFNTLSRFVHSFPCKEQVSFNFIVEITVHSDFGTQENKICHYFHFLPIYLPWSDETRGHDLSFFECWVLSFSLSSLQI